MRRLRSEQHGIEHAILLIEQSDRNPVGAAVGRPHTKLISTLRSEREDIGHAIVSLKEYRRLTHQHSESAKWILKIRQLIS